VPNLSSPAADPEERARIVAIAERALGRVVSSGLLPDPVTFEVWFTYYSETNPGLHRDVDILIRSRGLTAASMQAVHDQHLSPTRAIHRLLAAGEGLQDEARTVGTIIAAAHSSATLYRADLDTVTHRVDRTEPDQGLDTIIADLVASTDSMRRTTERLQEQLGRSEQQVSELRRRVESIQADSLTDTVTAIGNRKQFDRTLAQMIEIAEGTGTPLALALADVDRFKDFNDQFGHQTGDDVLRLVAAAIGRQIRDSDLVARYGGDEFAILFPRTELRDAVLVSERIREAVGEKDLVRRSSQESLGRISVSVGVAAHTAGGNSDGIVHAADQCLLAAKRKGRNCVIGVGCY
jgi:diguanylate cyclase (GGDEF)-like protein